MPEETKAIRRHHFLDSFNRYWWVWSCDICSDSIKYLNKDAMLQGSLAHRDKHRNKRGRTSS